MIRDDLHGWMWSEAMAALARAERLHGRFFHPRPAARPVAWEPPVDVIEQDGRLLILVALPGVDPEAVEVAIEDGALLVAGRRVLPPELRTAVIHRMELPQGRFERRVALPPGRYAVSPPAVANGCLALSLRKLA